MKPFSLNIGGKLKVFDRPLIMGILNVTDDSFYSASRTMSSDEIKKKAALMLEEGADIIDIGACSTRPGSLAVTEEKELNGVLKGLEIVRCLDREIMTSVDTFRSSVAESAIENGASIVNDISGGMGSEDMFETIAKLKVPYVLTASEGIENVSKENDNDDITAETLQFFSQKIIRLRMAGVSDIIVDPGVGFSKSLNDNYRLLKNINLICQVLDLPVLVGLSRKSLITKTLEVDPSEALNGTTALNAISLLQGAAILRVHDVRAAFETRELFCKFEF